MKYWFKPKRFWGCFAFYYPSSKGGWVTTIVLLAVGGFLFVFIDSRSHSVSDTLIGFAPWAIALMALFDLFCCRAGEYPSWWKKKSE
jgi:hypothetical protein